MKYDNMELDELLNAQQQLQQSIEAKLKQKMQLAYEQANAIAQDVGLTLIELANLNKPKGKSAKPKAAIAVKYRHPDDEQLTWSGRGKQPRWIKEWLDAGKSLDELTV